MRTAIKYTVVLLTSVLLLADNRWYSQSQTERAVNKCKPLLVGYDYDGYLSEEIIPGNEEKTEVISFTAFRGISYRILFCLTSNVTPVTIKVYDRAAKEPNRKKVFDSSELPDNSNWVFEPKVSRRYYVEYTVAADSRINLKKSYMVMVIGANLNRAAEIAYYSRD